jgi:hypothetical protein
MQSMVYRDDAQIIGYRSCAKVYGERPAWRYWLSRFHTVRPPGWRKSRDWLERQLNNARPGAQGRRMRGAGGGVENPGRLLPGAAAAVSLLIVYKKPNEGIAPCGNAADRQLLPR